MSYTVLEFLPLAYVLLGLVAVLFFVRRVNSNIRNRSVAGVGSPPTDRRTFSKTVIAAPIAAAVFPLAGVVVSILALRQTAHDPAVRGRRIAIFALVYSVFGILWGVVLLSNPTFRSHTYFG